MTEEIIERSLSPQGRPNEGGQTDYDKHNERELKEPPPPPKPTPNSIK